MLDRSLTYRRHLELLRHKLTSRVALLRQLTDSGWGAGATSLRIATLALVHSTAEYWAPAWCQSAHTRLIDSPQNNALQIVTGCLCPTPADNLPILAGIQPAELRCTGTTLSIKRCAMEPWHLFHSHLLFIEWECTASQIEIPICTWRTTSHHLIWQQQQQHTCSAVGGSPMECRVGRQDHKTLHFHPWHQHLPPGMTLPRRARLNRLCTGVRRFHSCLSKWGMASSVACECGAEEQTVNHVVLQCLIHWPPHGLHGLTILDDETIEWLLNTAPRSSAAASQSVVWTIGWKEEAWGWQLFVFTEFKARFGSSLVIYIYFLHVWLTRIMNMLGVTKES